MAADEKAAVGVEERENGSVKVYPRTYHMIADDDTMAHKK